MEIVISDTSIITNLTSIGYLFLLPRLYDRITVPEAVYRELVNVASPVPGTLEIQTVSWLEVRQVTNSERVEYLQTIARLDPGESEAIALALELSASLLLIDERRGRREADRLGIKITGLLGILVEAKQKKLVNAVKPLMDSLIATSEFRVSIALYDRILEMVGEA